MSLVALLLLFYASWAYWKAGVARGKVEEMMGGGGQLLLHDQQTVSCCWCVNYFMWIWLRAFMPENTRPTPRATSSRNTPAPLPLLGARSALRGRLSRAQVKEKTSHSFRMHLKAQTPLPLFPIRRSPSLSPFSLPLPLSLFSPSVPSQQVS